MARETSSRSASKKTTGRKTRTSSTRRTTSRSPEGNGRRCAEVMTPEPVTLLETQTLVEAAKVMRERDIGDVIVLDDTAGRVMGIVTDRDVVVRGVAEECEPERTTVGSICSSKLETVTPDDPVAKAVKLMRDKAIRRLPVVEDGHAIGVISIGDLAQELDDRSALADISSAPANE